MAQDARTAAPRSPARWPLLLALVLLGLGLLTLLGLRNRVVAEERAFLAYAVRLFELSGALQRPENDAVRFSQIESIARSIEERDLVRSLLVSKQTARGERLVYPFYHELLNPGWRAETSTWLRLPIGGGNDTRGYLYVQTSSANRTAIDRSIGAFAVTLVGCLAVLVFRTRGKEAELQRTVSELEVRKAEVIRLERLALAGQLSANIFHDIKKPVLNIKHEAGDALEAGTGEVAALRAIREQTELFLRMLRELGFEQFVRAEQEAGEYCDVPGNIEQALALVRYERGDVEVALRLPRDGSLPLVFAPPHRLIQLFSNLFLNAFQAMNGKGTLTVEAMNVGDSVEIRIDDTGPGVPRELRASIFEAFVSTKPSGEGTGLGLYICSKIASDLGGSIHVEDCPGGRGARFVVRLRSRSGPST